MSETRSMTEKSSTSATRQPALCRGDRSGRPSNKERSGVCVAGQCRRSVPTRPSDRNRLFQPASYPVPCPENGKIYENLDSLHTVYIHALPFLAISCHFLPFLAISCHFSPLFCRLLTVPAFIRRQIHKCRTSLTAIEAIVDGETSGFTKNEAQSFLWKWLGGSLAAQTIKKKGDRRAVSTPHQVAPTRI